MVGWFTASAMRASRRLAVPAWEAPSFLRWPARHIRWKIILPYAFLVVVLAAVQTYVATNLVEGNLDERFENQLLEASRAAGDSVVRREQAHLEVARTVAFSQGLAASTANGDERAVTSVIHNIAANTGTEHIEVLTASGQRLAAVHVKDPAQLEYAAAAPDDPKAWPLVQLILANDEGRKFAQIIETADGVMLMTAAPVFDGGELAGAVLVGTSLETLAAATKSEALADVTLYDFEGRPLASTFVQDAESADLFADSAGFGAGVMRESRVIWERHHDLVYGELVVGGALVGYYSVALPSDFIFSAGSETRWQMTLIFGVGMALVLATGLLLARALTGRIGRLVTTAERVTEGDLTARTAVTSEDELGRLAVCLNRMTDRLEGQYMATMRALASAVAGKDPYTVRHSVRVGDLATLLGRHLGVGERTLAQLEIGGYLHDVGKIGIRDSGLFKSNSVALSQKRFIRSHPHIGIEAPELSGVRDPVLDFIGGEKSSHPGPPAGRAGLPAAQAGNGAQPDDTYIVSRIVAVADLYDALTADRPEGSGTPMTSDEGLEVLRAAAAARVLHFGTVEALARIVPEWERAQGRGSDYRQLAETRRR